MPRARLLILPLLGLCAATWPAPRLAAASLRSAVPDAGGSAKIPAPPATATAPAPPARSTVTVRIQGLRHDRGKVFVALYDNKRAFAEKRGQAAGAIVAPRNRGAVVVFDNVLPGQYALAFFQDENGNQKLDTSLFGVPTEPFGFSRDAMGKLGPPSFEAAALDLPAGPVSVVMNAKHL
jgi:uncharacterized protein (DUF2141 family)